MPAAMLTQDILAICLLHADGNIDLSLENILFHAETYQERQNRHFGISRSDFRGLFHMLMFCELGMKKFGEDIENITLRDMLPEILKYHSAYFNDEGEHWIKDDDWWHEEERFGYHAEKYQEKVKLKEDMKTFFQQGKLPALNPPAIKSFMEELQLSEALLYHCSRPGESS